MSRTVQMRFRRFPLSLGDAGVARTIQWMRALAMGDEGAANPKIRATAISIVSDVANRDFRGEAQAIFDWVKKNIKFRGEYAETIQSPLVTLELQAGDCDDHATLIAALLATIGHAVKFKTVATSGQDFTHVYAVAIDKRTGAEIPMDTTVDRSSLGWQPEHITRAREWKPMGNVVEMPRRRGLGDEVKQQPTKVDTAVKIIQQFDPLISAAAQRLAYGSKAGLVPFQQDFSRTGAVQRNADGSFSATVGNLPTAAVLTGVGLLGLGMFAIGMRRG